jgi:phenylalanyl-tRNA synthetase beta chain
MRAITLLVDITNYVMLELGHPLHAFDLSSVPQIYVRRARPGEALRTLDGVDRGLSPEVLLITDGRRPVAVAGVIGGKETEVTEATQNVLLEAACFCPARVRRSARALGLRTEASLRFERALSPETADPSSRRFCTLLARPYGQASSLSRAGKMPALRAGHIAQGAVDAYPRPPRPKRLCLRKARLREILGVEIPEGEIGEKLAALGVELSERGDRWEARVPPFRVDLEREIDLIEEVARLFGYDRIPATAPRVAPRVGGKDQNLAFADRIRRILMALGLAEAYTFGLVPREKAEVTLRNPMATGQEGLRLTLLPQLLAAMRENLEAQAPGVALFEVGRVFRRAGEGIVEEDRLGVVLCGRLPLPLSGKAEYSPADLKGILDALLVALRVEGVTLGEVEDDRLHPYRRAGIYLATRDALRETGKGDFPHPSPITDHGSRKLIGWLGELSPSSVDLPGGRRAFALEVALAPLALAAQAPRYHPLPRFPTSKRDLSLLAPRDLAEGEVRTRILAQALVETCFLYDLYQGPGIPLDCRSLTYEITFRHPERTLETWEVEEAMGQILGSLAPLGVRLRT